MGHLRKKIEYLKLVNESILKGELIKIQYKKKIRANLNQPSFIQFHSFSKYDLHRNKTAIKTTHISATLLEKGIAKGKRKGIIFFKVWKNCIFFM